MTPDQIVLVEQSIAELTPELGHVAADFYDRLFAAEPETERLFSSEPSAQQHVFAAELRMIGLSIRRHDEFVHEVSELGNRHRGYGVRASHYRAAGPHLLAALESASGTRWTPEVAEAWRLAYNLVAEAMMASPNRPG